jgi:HEAT repeat protein
MKWKGWRPVRLYLPLALVFFGVLGPLAPLAAAEADDPDARALRAAGLSDDGAALVRYFRERTPADADPAVLVVLVTQLGDDNFGVRERATARLARLGAAARPALREAARSADPEVARRARALLEQVKAEAPDCLVACAAARVLARRRPAGAAEVLLAFLGSIETESVAEEVRAALAEVAYARGRPDKVLTAALDSKWHVTRAAAAEALIRTGSAEQRRELLGMLRDRDVHVRLTVARALAAGGRKEAVPVLIGLLAELPAEEVWRAEEPLQQLAGEDSPAAPEGQGERARQDYRDAWAAWWKRNADRVDLGCLDPARPPLGRVLVLSAVPLGPTRVMELDREGKVRWEFDGPQNVSDARFVGPDRVLLAEPDKDRVTERTAKGEIVWQATAKGVCSCQRLPDGTTFITCHQGQLLEVNRAGKVLRSLTYRPQGDLWTARRLPSGEIVALTMAGRMARLDRAGKEVASVPVHDRNPYRTTCDILPNGHLLMPQTQAERVVEYDADGKLVWMAPVKDEPSAALRLPNGHTLVSAGSVLTELDRSGRVVSTRLDQSWNVLAGCR